MAAPNHTVNQTQTGKRVAFNIFAFMLGTIALLMLLKVVFGW